MTFMNPFRDGELASGLDWSPGARAVGSAMLGGRWCGVGVGARKVKGCSSGVRIGARLGKVSGDATRALGI